VLAPGPRISVRPGGRGSGRDAPGTVEWVWHAGSARNYAGLALLLAVAREWLSSGAGCPGSGDLPVFPARMDEAANWTGESPYRRVSLANGDDDLHEHSDGKATRSAECAAFETRKRRGSMNGWGHLRV